MAKMAYPHAVDLGKKTSMMVRSRMLKCRDFLWLAEVLRQWHGSEPGTAICLCLLVSPPTLVIAFRFAVALSVQEPAVNVCAEETLNSTLNTLSC
jgi:hypothetical protein